MAMSWGGKWGRKFRARRGHVGSHFITKQPAHPRIRRTAPCIPPESNLRVINDSDTTQWQISSLLRQLTCFLLLIRVLCAAEWLTRLFWDFFLILRGSCFLTFHRIRGFWCMAREFDAQGWQEHDTMNLWLSITQTCAALFWTNKNIKPLLLYSFVKVGEYRVNEELRSNQLSRSLALKYYLLLENSHRIIVHERDFFVISTTNVNTVLFALFYFLCTCH